MFSHLQYSRAPPYVMVTWNDKYYHSWHSPLPSSSSFMCWARCHMAWHIPWVSWGSAFLPISSPNSLCSPSTLPGEWGEDAEKALMLCKHCPAIVKTSVLPALSQLKSKTFHSTCYRHKVNSTPDQPAQLSSLAQSGVSSKTRLSWSCSLLSSAENCTNL